MNKGRRNELAQLKKKKRLRHLVNNLDVYITKDGRYIHKPKVTDIPKTEYNVYKSTGKPCSCPMCSPGKIQDKAKYKNP
jgi:hypothetical protein